METKQERTLLEKYWHRITIIIFRLCLGGLFIYSGLFKILNPSIFYDALTRYGLFPNSFTKLVSIIFPWFEITIGIFLLFKVLIKIASIITILLLVLFTIITILAAFKGTVGSCGCFSDSFILNFSDPVKIVIRNVLLAAVACLLFLHYEGKLNSSTRSIVKAATFAYSILLAISISILLVMIGKRSNENNVYRMYLEDREIVMDLVSETNVNQYQARDLVKTKDIYSDNKKEFTLILMINSFDCTSCIDEAQFVEYLANKYKEYLQVIAVSGVIGKTAVRNFSNRHKLTYIFVQERNSVLSKLLNIKTLKILINREGIIVHIDPPTFKSRRIRESYEDILVRLIKGGDKNGQY